MKSNSGYWLLRILAPAALMLPIQPLVVQAQTAAELQSVERLEEIIVTAAKRSEKLQDVPVAISAITATQLEALGIRGNQDLSRVVPSLSFVQTSPGQNSLSIRGMTTAYNLSPTVSYYLDEVPLDFRTDIRSSAPDIDLFDVNRVEVLRGPQGTLFGAGSLGGSVRVLTNRPQLNQNNVKVQLSGSTVNGGGSGFGAKVVGNIALSDRAALRVNVYRERFAGFTSRIVPLDYANPLASDPVASNDLGTNTRTTAKLAALWSPDDTWRIEPSFLYQDSKVNGYNWGDSNRNDFSFAGTFDPTYRDKLRIANLLVDKDLAGMTATSSTSYIKKSTDGVEDYSAFAYKLYGLIGGVANPPLVPVRNYFPVDYSIFSQELRLTSNGNDRLKWVAGAYFQRSKYFTRQIVLSDEFGAFLAGAFGAPVTNDVISYYSPIVDRQYAIFGDISYDLTNHVNLALGLRGYRLEQEIAITQTGLLAGPNNPQVDSSQKGVNPKVALQYRFSSDAQVYAQAAKGFRPGGGNPALVDTGSGCTFQTAYRPAYNSDTAYNYEIGEKVRFLDRRLAINTALYRVDWKKIQGLVSSNCGVFNANIGQARINGVETEIEAEVLHGLLLRGTLSYNDAKIDSLDPGVVGIGIPEGSRVINVPRVQYSAGIDYALPMASDFKPSFRVNVQHVGSNPTSYTSPDPRAVRPAYTNLDAGFSASVGSVDIDLMARNLTNSNQITTVTFGGLSTPPGAARYTFNPPRTLQLTINWRSK